MTTKEDKIKQRIDGTHERLLCSNSWRDGMTVQEQEIVLASLSIAKEVVATNFKHELFQAIMDELDKTDIPNMYAVASAIKSVDVVENKINARHIAKNGHVS